MDPLLDKFAGVSRKHWLANRLFFQDLSVLLKSLRARDVRTMVPGEMALALQHFPGYPLDPLGHRTIVVCARRAVTAFEVLEAGGWIPTPRPAAPLLDHYVDARSWHPFRGPEGGRLHLYWHVLPQRATSAVDRGYWSRATEVSVGEESVAALSPTDQVVQLCTRRMAMRMAPLFIRAVDVMMLLSACPGQIDWGRLIEESAEPGLILPIRDTLNYLQDRLDEPVPAHVFRRIQTHRASGLERLEYELTGPRTSRLRDVLGLWLDYRRAAPGSLLASAVRFPRFLQHYLKSAHFWQMPFRAIARVVDHMREPTGKAQVNRPRARDASTSGR